MPDMQKVLETKNRIISTIKQRGPELPVRVASAIGQSNLFTAAFMAELVSEQKLKLSSMKVGGSPLYYIEGQEEQLQKYTEYLNHKEKEAFKLLKEKEILQDSEQEPAIRVALRSIKDFAVPLKILDKSEEKIFWKLHTIQNDKAKEIIENLISPKEKQDKKPEVKEEVKQDEKVETEKEEEKIEKKEAKTQKQKEITSNFLASIKEELSKKNYEILQEILTKKKEFTAKIKINTEFGQQNLYLVAKDKKKITLEDIVNTLQKSQAEKMPALIISPGDIDKKALEYYKEWSNLIKHQKLNL